MNGFLLLSLFNFGLLLLALYLIIHLFQKVRQLENEDNKEVKNDIDEMLTAYLIDIRHENERLVEKIREEPDKGGLQETMEPPTVSPPTQQVSDRVEQTDTARALSLFDQGYDSTEIAKKLDKGRGEIELILKLYRKH